MLQRMFCHCHFLQKRPRVSSAGRDKSLLVPLAGVPQERAQIPLLPGPINPVISSARPKQITIAPGHLQLVIPDDFGWDAQQQESLDPWAGGLSFVPRYLHPTPGVSHTTIECHWLLKDPLQ